MGSAVLGSIGHHKRWPFADGKDAAPKVGHMPLVWCICQVKLTSELVFKSTDNGSFGGFVFVVV